jgi:hypothetical protein
VFSVSQESVDLRAPIVRQGQHSKQSIQSVHTGFLDTECSKIVQAALQPGGSAMTKMRALLIVAPMAVSFLAVAHEASKKAVAQEGGKTTDNNSDFEHVLWDADQQWLCNSPDGPYYKKGQECVEFRRKYWTDRFFEISDQGQVRTKAQMIATQSATHYVPVIPYPDDFKLMAVYGNFALATDHTVLKTKDASGKPVTTDTRVLRMFVKENGNWRPAGAALVPIVSQ